MDKSILVIDTPDNCASCPMSNQNLYDMSKGGVYCNLNKGKSIPWRKANKEKPDWCPLQEIPEKQVIHCIDTWQQRTVKTGWNMCIDAILKDDAQKGSKGG